MATSGKLEGLIVISSGYQVSVTDSGGTSSVPLPDDTEYYLSSIGNGSAGLIQQLEDELNSEMTDTFNVSISAGEAGTGKVTISCNANFSLTWTSTTLRDLLGFTGNLSGTNTYTGTYQARSLWLPYPAAKQTLYGDADAGWYESDRRVVEAPTGQLYGWYGNKRRVNAAAWTGVRRRKVRIAGESTVNESFERFWLDQVLAEAAWALPDGSVRLYWDADNDASYATYKVSSGAEQNRHEPMMENFVGLWTVALPRLVATS